MLYENQEFEQLLKENDYQTRRENWQRKENKMLGEYIYLDFCVWCNAYNKGNGKDNAKLFAKFLKRQNIELTFWQHKHLGEKYFGYSFEYDSIKKGWWVKLGNLVKFEKALEIKKVKKLPGIK